MDAMSPKAALKAIEARIHGEWDSIELEDVGPLSESTACDVLDIVDAGLRWGSGRG